MARASRTILLRAIGGPVPRRRARRPAGLATDGWWMHHGTGPLARADRHWSGLETSPPARVPIPIQPLKLIDFFTKCPEPPPKTALAPRGCRPRAAFQPSLPPPIPTMQSMLGEFGG